MTKRRVSVSLVLLLSLGLLVPALVRRPSGMAQEVVRRPPDPQPKRALQGAQSCATSACHGGSALGERFSEATTWRALDPHAGAYDTLLTAASRAIAKYLWGDKTAANEAALCLKCHVDSSYEQASANFRRQDGVSCESCHGAAQDWLSPHYRDGWRAMTPERKRALGWADTKTLAGRAGVCARCHVGTPDSSVDHELIAAGHPALRFEFATYLANLPPHWDAAKDKAAHTSSARPSCVDFEARAWATGQLVAAASALELLAHRAAPQAGRTWPELAEMDCFSCHHDLHGQSWRQNKSHLRVRQPGSFVWGDWYYALLPDLLKASAAQDAAVTPSVPALPEILQLRAVKGTEERAALAGSARQLAAALKADANAPRFLKLDFCKVLPLAVPLGKNELPDSSWDQATQRYLALLALRQVNKDNKLPANGDVQGALDRLRRELPFGPNLQSPARFSPGAARPLDE